jgi:DNA-binding NarL/FixJ family response regulator
MTSLKVLLVDDHRLIRKAISALLSNEDEIHTVWEASNSTECFQLMEMAKPDIVLMDISLDDVDGISITRELIQKQPDLKVIILSMHLEENYIKQSVKAGAKGYILKNSPHEDLIKAVFEVANGGQYFAQEVSKIMAQNYLMSEKNTDSRYHKDEILTKRELEIVKLVAEGLNNQKIADLLCISHRTVDTHRTNIMQKVKVKNVAELVRYAIKNRLVEI